MGRIQEKFLSTAIHRRKIVYIDGRMRMCCPIACVWLDDYPESM